MPTSGASASYVPPSTSASSRTYPVADVPAARLERYDEGELGRGGAVGEQGDLRVAEDGGGHDAAGEHGRRRDDGCRRWSPATATGGANAAPTAAPSTGPRATFCGRTPRVPPSSPVAVPTTTGPAGVSRPASQPSGATRAALVAMRANSGGISPGRWRARASRSVAARGGRRRRAPRWQRRGDRGSCRAPHPRARRRPRRTLRRTRPPAARRPGCAGRLGSHAGTVPARPET
jgi:hypothetical protein